MSDLPPPGFPPPGDPPPPRPPQQPASPLPSPGAPDGSSGIGRPPTGGVPQFGAPTIPPPAATPIVPVQAGGPKKPWWKGPAGYIAGLGVVAAIVVGVVLAVSGGNDHSTTKTTDSVEQANTRPARTVGVTTVTTPARRTTTTPDAASAGTEPDFTLPDLTNPPTTVPPVTKPGSGSPTTSSATPATTAPVTPTGALAIGGQALVTDGTDSIQVAVLDLVDNAPATEFLPPDAGQKFVALKFRFVNPGTTSLSITPSFSSKLIDASNQQFDAAFNPTTLGPGISAARLVPADVRIGWITFQVPTASVAAQVQWKLNFGDSGAEWDLTLPRQDPPASPRVVAATTAFNTPVTVTSADGVPIAVSVMQVVDNATPTLAGSTDTNRYVAVQMTFSNAGKAKFSDAPEFDVQLIDSDGQQYSTFIFGTDAGPGFDGQIDLSPGDARTGYISFEVPKAATPVKLQVVLGGSLVTDVGELALA